MLIYIMPAQEVCTSWLNHVAYILISYQVQALCCIGKNVAHNVKNDHVLSLSKSYSSHQIPVAPDGALECTKLSCTPASRCILGEEIKSNHVLQQIWSATAVPSFTKIDHHHLSAVQTLPCFLEPSKLSTRNYRFELILYAHCLHGARQQPEANHANNSALKGGEQSFCGKLTS